MPKCISGHSDPEKCNNQTLVTSSLATNRDIVDVVFIG